MKSDSKEPLGKEGNLPAKEKKDRDNPSMGTLRLKSSWHQIVNVLKARNGPPVKGPIQVIHLSAVQGSKDCASSSTYLILVSASFRRQRRKRHAGWYKQFSVSVYLCPARKAWR